MLYLAVPQLSKFVSYFFAIVILKLQLYDYELKITDYKYVKYLIYSYLQG
jgi:hypothetical protein